MKKQCFLYDPVMDGTIREYLLEKQVVIGFKTQDDMADAIGVKKSTLSKWLAGTSTPDYDSMKKISDGLGVPLQEVLDAREGKYKPLSKAEREVLEIEKKYNEETKRLLAERLQSYIQSPKDLEKAREDYETVRKEREKR